MIFLNLLNSVIVYPNLVTESQKDAKSCDFREEKVTNVGLCANCITLHVWGYFVKNLTRKNKKDNLFGLGNAILHCSSDTHLH